MILMLLQLPQDETMMPSPISALTTPYASTPPPYHQGESCVNRRRLTSHQANVKQDKSRAQVKRKSSKRRAHITLLSYTKSCDIQ
ncbi:hypothetical protein O181_026966 [Austropuccinia psidii MF-1]|uniref:Uncharacterized protein n=1 Tax=Austropuccinia psidii MF-1 TaxID=1389203 RepID=A0A9Q3CRI9_9BASI|nr:hypothetical protein [Austropuccinia psidii MF-1]